LVGLGSGREKDLAIVGDQLNFPAPTPELSLSLSLLFSGSSRCSLLDFSPEESTFVSFLLFSLWQNSALLEYLTLGHFRVYCFFFCFPFPLAVGYFFLPLSIISNCCFLWRFPRSKLSYAPSFPRLEILKGYFLSSPQ